MTMAQIKTATHTATHATENASDIMRLLFAVSAQAFSSFRTVSRRCSPACRRCALSDTLVSYLEGMHTRISAYSPDSTRGTVHVTDPSALTETLPLSGP